MAKKKTEAFQPDGNGGKRLIEEGEPYIAHVTLKGVSSMLFHSYDVHSVGVKTGSGKGSAAKKTDDIDSYVYRVSEDDERLGVPGMNFCRALAIAAKSVSDPRSPRKSMMDLVAASVIPLDEVAPFHTNVTTWDFVDTRRVVIQRNGIPRQRPGMNKGWKITFHVAVHAPEYIPPDTLHMLAVRAGQFQGLCDYRPTFGRFAVVKFETGLLELEEAA